MTNPYSAPESNLQSAKTGIDTKPNGVLRWFATGASILAIGVLLIIALMLIPQALRLASENATLPPRLQSANPSGVLASWVGGIVAVCGVLGNILGLFLIRSRKVALPLTIFVLSVVSMVAFAVVFKPV
jgi:hypothetical protein